MNDEIQIKPTKEELTEKMHSEFTVSKETEVRLRTGCVWDVTKYDRTKGNFVWSEEAVRKEAASYGISYEDCMKHKEYWRRIVEKQLRQNASK